MLGHRLVTKKYSSTHHPNASYKGGRECVDNVHSWREPFRESLIIVRRLIEFVGFPSKHGEDRFRGITDCYLFRERVGNEFFSGLSFVLFQGPIEYWLKIWSGRRSRHAALQAALSQTRVQGDKYETRTRSPNACTANHGSTSNLGN